MDAAAHRLLELGREHGLIACTDADSRPAPDWGLMISEARGMVMIAPWIVLFPALAIGIAVVAINVLADGLSTKGAKREARYL